MEGQGPSSGRSRGPLAAVVVVALIFAAVAWLPLLAGVVWPGTAVLERCDAAAADEFGESYTFAVPDAQHVRWWPPGWTCPLSNGEAVTVSAWP